MLWTLNFSNARSLSNVGWNVVVVAFYVNWQNARIDDDRRWLRQKKYVQAQVMCARCEIPPKTFLDTEKTSDAFDDFSFLFIFSFYFWNANESIIESVYMKTLLFLEYVWWRDSVVGRRRHHELTSLWWRFWSVVATSSLLDLSSQCEERKKIEIHFDFNLKFLSMSALEPRRVPKHKRASLYTWDEANPD